MAGKDVGRFRLNTNRREQLTLQQELDDVSRKSLLEIASTREFRRTEPLTQTQNTFKKLAPSFDPVKPAEKRKTHPIFHVDIADRPPKPKLAKQNVEPVYNALDKADSNLKMKDPLKGKSKKFPFNKETTITTTDMKKPHVSSVGVVPANAGHPTDIPGLKVLVEGRTAHKHDDPILGPVERANTAPLVEESVDLNLDLMSYDMMDFMTQHGPKPAILGASGTTAPAAFTQRPPPVPKPKTRLRPQLLRRTKSAKSDASSFNSVEINLADEQIYSRYDDAIADIDKDETTLPRSKSDDRKSACSVKSVKELVEEAQQIASPEGKRHIKIRKDNEEKDAKGRGKGRAPIDKRKAPSSKSTKSDSHSHKSEEVMQNNVRSVDEIISSLKDQSIIGVATEADKKIQEIMLRVLDRSKAVLGDLAPQDDEETEEEPTSTSSSPRQQSPLGSYFSATEATIESRLLSPGYITDDSLSGRKESEMAETTVCSISEGGGRSKTEITISQYTQGTGQDNVQSPEELERGDGYPESSEEKRDMAHSASTTEAIKMEEILRELEEARQMDEEAVSRLMDERLQIERDQALEDANAPAIVTLEDIVSVKARALPLHTPHSNSKPSSIYHPEGKQDWVDPMQPKPAEKSIHHFCTQREDIQMPDPARGIWRRYHVPSKVDCFYQAIKKTPGYAGHPGSMMPSEMPKESSTPHGQRELIDRQQSAAARKILEEASKIGQKEAESLLTWTQRAQAVFDNLTLSVGGEKLSLKSDESYLYWTPAPPKWDVAPTKVKETLFPEYHGTDIGIGSEVGTTPGLEDLEEESDGEDEQTQVDPEEKLARERTLGRAYGSSKDMTAFSKAQLEAAIRDSPEDRSKEVACSMRLKHVSYSPELANPAAQKTIDLTDQIRSMLTSALVAALGRNFKGLDNITFSPGSVIVHFMVKVPVNALDSLVIDDIQEALGDMIRDNKTAGLRIDLGSLDVEAVPCQMEEEETTESKFETRSAKLRHTLAEFNTHCPRPPTRGLRMQSDLAHAPSATSPTEQTSLPTVVQPLRPDSAPGNLDTEADDFLLIQQDFNSIMEEIGKQKQELRDQRVSKKADIRQEETAARLALLDHPDMINSQLALSQEPSMEQLSPVAEEHSSASLSGLSTKLKDEATPAELALEAGRSYVILPPKRKKKGGRKKHLTEADMARIEELERFLRESPSQISRTESMQQLHRIIERPLRIPAHVRTTRRGSLPSNLSMQAFKLRRGYKAEEQEEREWVRQIWEDWFDQRFPPTPEESEWDEDLDEPFDDNVASFIREEKALKRKSSASTVYSDGIEVAPVIADDEGQECVELLEEEIQRLNAVIEASDEVNAFNHCRRGAILRKLGRIGPAIEDLSLALEHEPLMLDAYWHRHFIYVLQNRGQQALNDLNIILKHNKTHAGAYRSRASIYRDMGDITMAVVNFTQAIKHDENDYEAYYQRAEMYEKRGEMLLAMEDYACATRINPAKTEALFKHGMHYFENGHWQNAVEDFSQLLKQEPNNAVSHMFRGRAYANLKQWNHAVADLSAAIHLDPRNVKAYYYRGCLLRKLHPKKAIMDLSISLMMDDTDRNILSYLHRGILYNDIGKHEDAIPDFESVLKLDKDMACAHTNLGLIFMLKMENNHRAIKKFTNAVKSDPTYVKAYICRAEAHTKIHDIKNALLDITRAIHLRPDMHHLYMYRGQLVLKMGNLDLASFCVRHAAELKEGLGHSPTQQAIVQSFLNNYDKAIDALQGASRVKPVPPIFLLLGKTQMKAHKWGDAVGSFSSALELVKPWQRKQSWPMEAAEMYYLVGMCHLEMRDYTSAHDAFNNSIKIDQKCAEAFYWRGMTRMKLRQYKGVQDFNKALTLNPTYFQAYLSRAAYYGLKGQYKKGILNCNEAIRIQPNSVRGYLYRGALKYHIKVFQLAIRDLSKAIAIDNQCSLAYFNRAICHQDSGNYIKALQDYGIVLLLGDYLILKVLINRGLLYLEVKDHRNALHDFLQAAAVNPEDKRIHHTLGLCYHKLDRLQEAVRSFTTALSLDPFFLDALIGRGNVFMDFGHEIGQKYARHDYERALHQNPLCLPARVNLAYSLQVAGRYQQAWHQLTRTVEINPRYQPALEGRAIINLQMSDTFAAFQDIQASINVLPTAELLTNRGVIHQFMGDRLNAMRDYQAALKLDSSYSLAHFNAANVYFHQRQFKQALTFYSDALQYNSRDESALLNRAITKVMLKDVAGALPDFGDAIALSPHSAHMYFNRGNLQASLGNYENSESDYSKALQLQPDDPLVHKRRGEVRGKLGRKDEAIADFRHAILIQSKLKQ